MTESQQEALEVVERINAKFDRKYKYGEPSPMVSLTMAGSYYVIQMSIPSENSPYEIPIYCSWDNDLRKKNEVDGEYESLYITIRRLWSQTKRDLDKIKWR